MKEFKEIVNRKAKYEYQFLSTYEAGITLVGTEVKSIKTGEANISDAYCLFNGGELIIKSLYIAEYRFGNLHNHETRRDRKLLLKKAELKKIERRVNEKGNTIVPYKIYLNERGLIKLEIAVAQGKKTYDKRESLKAKDQKREMDRIKKINL
ncbi:MAG: SsrA-binding protein SmpB [Saprospiraceae bacterium]